MPRAWAWPAIGVAVGGYGALLLWLRLNEARLIFFPDRQLRPSPPVLRLEERQVEILTPDGLHLTGWAIPAAADSLGLWLLLFHGNAGNLSTEGRPEHDRQLRDLGLNILAIDYRGYGASEGQPSESGLYADAEASYRYLRDRLAVSPDRIVIYGHSLGAAVAIDLASRVDAAGLIAEGAFTSVPELGREFYPFIPVRWVTRSRFASIDKIHSIAMPKLFIHARADATIPMRHGLRLFEEAQPPKTFLEVAGGHDDAFLVDAAAYQDGITRFLRSITR